MSRSSADPIVRGSLYLLPRQGNTDTVAFVLVMDPDAQRMPNVVALGDFRPIDRAARVQILSVIEGQMHRSSMYDVSYQTFKRWKRLG